MEYFCKECIEKYFEQYPSHGPGFINEMDGGGYDYLCPYCNKYGKIYHPHIGAKRKRRLPLKREYRLKKMYIKAHVSVNFNVSFDGPIEEIIKSLNEFNILAGCAGYTHVHFDQEDDYDETNFLPYGIRLETNKEMNRRFKKIKRNRERKAKMASARKDNKCQRTHTKSTQRS